MKWIAIVAVLAIPLAGCSNIGLGQSLAGLPATGMPPPDFSPMEVDPTLVKVARDIDRVDDRIDAARDSGDLSRREARGLRREAGVIASLARRYSEDGLSVDEARELETRSRVLESQVEAQKFVSKDADKPD